MKKLVIAAAAAMTVLSPLAATSASADPRDYRQGYREGDRRGDWDRGDRYDRRDDRRDYRRGYREGYRHDRWDDRRYNGYYYQNRWNYGPPPSAYYGRPGFRADYRDWRRGDRLPGYYRSRYIVVRDYDRYGLRYPPRGYHWVRDDRGGYLLVGIATGIILGSMLDGYGRY
ncbi:MAG: RcnB family protein [Hyphomonadaceae bacterium]|nr:RcnB family protein [Hyphomonadaceae bacterium]